MDIQMYRSRTGEVGNKAHWKLWAEKFYDSLSYDEFDRRVKCEIVMPEDWWPRITKVLRLEAI